ncbi:ATP-grasp domain-containing protein [Salisediminibacterium selenitireducens]|uniref:RimK domain protein ATP-grasp n=1 Tax=Bacillus selenitireducens (strain ATCC 700615 / DSM 15326 / MLS10) TaxID=439292 RepID=D6XT09_BACIE|nr:ATP-grasp domain-containing protein [Salisediminibacterium selenitireducens]ADH98945.1 RimK domain protein ATP-grasp [[Bacillus] selenitireducens MLS10]
MIHTKTRTGWIIYRSYDIPRNRTFIDLLKKAATDHHITLSVVSYEDIIVKLGKRGVNPFVPIDGARPDFVMNRSISPWLNEVCETMGIPCFNSAYVSRVANDKRLAYATMAQLGVNMLESHALTITSALDNAILDPFILKDPLGRGGTGVMMVEPNESQHAIRSALPEDLIHQPVGGQKGKDVRVYVVGNEIVATVLRRSQTDFRANISQGGASSLYELSEPQRETVQSIINAIQLDYVGLDFLLTEDDELLFNEMEDAVGSRSLYMCSDINIAAILMEYLDWKLYHLLDL